MSRNSYFGDIRDRFDELYPTAASFVRLPSATTCANRYVAFHLDLDLESEADLFRIICYAYEDSYNWSELPLVFDQSLRAGMMRWMTKDHVFHGLKIDQSIIHDFDLHSQNLLQGK